MNLNELAQRAHQNAVKHGFWEVNHSVEHCLQLVICEIAEAVESDRKGRESDVERFNEMLSEVRYNNYISIRKIRITSEPTFDEWYQANFKFAFEKYIKDTVSDELADAVIRLLDLAGKRSVDLNGSYFAGCVNFNSNTFTENAFMFNYVVMECFCRFGYDFLIRSAISFIQRWCDALNIDLELHIEQKMRYNESGTYKHGKEY
jgi:hypothetical protein